MTEPTPGAELPSEVRALLRACIPALDALEVLILLACRRDESWTAETIAVALYPTRISAAAVARYLAGFRLHGLVPGGPDPAVRLEPATAALAEAVAGIVQAYEQRPVTLIRTVYALADEERIRSWADAFKINRDPR